MKTYKIFSKEAEQILKIGGVGVIPTDTLYGIVASAMDVNAVKRVYELRHRTPSKPFIILISSITDLQRFGIVLNSNSKKFLSNYWPGKISVILPCRSKQFYYLHRGKNSLAFRVPANVKLRTFLAHTGPLIAPSANIEGEPPAKTIVQAKKYFGDSVDFYIDSGRKDSKPSTLVKILKNKIVVVREGAVKI